MDKESWDKAIEFHGHVCPGLAIGYKVAEIALENLKESRADDEEIIAVVENDACGIDAIMVMTGCTLGKGNLILKDVGKQVYTFGSRIADQAIRISVNRNTIPGRPEMNELQNKMKEGVASEKEKEDYSRQRQQVIDDILNMPSEQFATIKIVDFALPEKASIFTSLECSCCGEYAMEPRTRNQNGQVVCLDCFVDYTRTVK